MPSGAIFLIYSIGSLNSSSVGQNVGASCNPNRRPDFDTSRASFGAPLRSTVERHKGWALRALKGIVIFPFCDAPLPGNGIPPILLRVPFVAVPFPGLVRAGVVKVEEELPPPLGTATIS